MSAEVVHRVGMALAAMTAVLCAMALVRETHRGRAVRRRLPAVWSGGPDRRGRDGARTGASARGRWRRRTATVSGGVPGKSRLLEWAGPLGAAGLVVILVGGMAGVLVGLAVGYGAHRRLVRQRGAEAARAAAAEVRSELAPAGDLLAACLAAGAGPREAAEAVGRTLDGPVAERLRQVAAELRLGGEPAVVWPRLAALPGAEGLARCMERAGISGVPAVESASRIAAELRAEQARAATAQARRAGVLVTLPLSACFLPAFLTLGVAPVLIGLAGGLLGRN
ncbi:type II secretion system F family protein [Streptomyces tubercidicus]|uniref:Membrane protein n=1 Tax=Streptomyces tubercidicus TaxID=47759 RepID=A0A640UV53_9ACTN|nr:type II secretion system F family protein [Streptomyces tubercidicus]WAU12770.1 type II secretion system F family protein [Streptomyces tubercidicus]GFE38265.1 membrane protein [Streptomyces tubercidicus]